MRDAQRNRQRQCCRIFGLFLMLFLLAVMQTLGCEEVSAETGTSKDLELLQAGMAATAGAASSLPSAAPAAAPEVVAENLVGEKVAAGEGDAEDEEADAGDIISCTTKISMVQLVQGMPVIVDQSSSVLLTGPMPAKEAFDRVIRLAEKDLLDPEKLVEVSFTCEFP